LGDVLELRRDPIDPNLGVRYRQIGVRGFGRGIFEYPEVSASGLGKLRYFTLAPDRLVVSNIKAWEGAVAVTMRDERGRIASNRFLTYALTMGGSLSYLAHWLLSDQGLTELGRASPGSADRNRTLSQVALARIRVPWPSVVEQDHIAAHLDSVAANVDGLVARRQAAARLGSAAMLPGMVDATLRARDLPLIAVSDLVDSVNDTIHPGGDYRGAHDFIGLEYIESHTGSSIGSRPVGDEAGRKFRFEPGDITFGYLRPYLNKVWVSDRVGLCSVEQFVLRPHSDVDGSLLGYVLRSQAVLDATRAATNSLQLPRLPLAVLLGLEVPDIRRADSGLLPSLNDLRDRVKSVVELRLRADALAGGIVAAARNEIFSAMR
jgi:hypothetical protein